MYQKSGRVSAIKPAEIQLRQDLMHVAWVQRTASEDWDVDKNHENRGTVYCVSNLDQRRESWCDIRQWTGRMDLHVNNINRSYFWDSCDKSEDRSQL